MSSWRLKVEGDFQRIVHTEDQRRRRPKGVPRILFIPVGALWTRIIRPALRG